MRKRATAILALVVLTMPAVSLAGAQEKEAKKLYDKGVALAKEGSYEEAISYFEEARTRGAPDETLFNLGKCYEALGLFHVAVDYYEEYLDSPQPKKPKKVAKLIEELRLKPSTLKFDSEPAGAEVRQVLLDGTESTLGTTPFEYRAEAGEFTFVIVKEGFEKKQITMETGYGKPFNLVITLGSDDVDVQVVDTSAKPEKHEVALGFPRVGLAVDLGGGVSLFPYPDVGFEAGGDFTLAVAYRFGHMVDTGLALGLRLDVRSYNLACTLESGERARWSAVMAHILAVPAYQFNLHERIGLELSLPLGIAVLSPPGSLPSTARIDLTDGFVSGGGLAMFELGLSASLRIALVSALYLVVEPVRMRILVPFGQWRPALFDMDILVRLGFEF